MARRSLPRRGSPRSPLTMTGAATRTSDAALIPRSAATLQPDSFISPSAATSRMLDARNRGRSQLAATRTHPQPERPWRLRPACRDKRTAAIDQVRETEHGDERREWRGSSRFATAIVVRVDLSLISRLPFCRSVATGAIHARPRLGQATARRRARRARASPARARTVAAVSAIADPRLPGRAQIGSYKSGNGPIAPTSTYV